MTESRPPRKRRANGEESRARILDAAAEIAGERGYEGTSISLVSAKCGLPASSIYWHFQDKDDLIAAVIERSFTAWLTAVTIPDPDGPGGAREQAVTLATHVAKALLDAPDFLRLGLMLTLERRPQEPRARQMFLQVREVARRRVAEFIAGVNPRLSGRAVQSLATYAMATADGLFIAREVGGDSVDLLDLFRLHAETMSEAVLHVLEDQDRALGEGAP